MHGMHGSFSLEPSVLANEPDHVACCMLHVAFYILRLRKTYSEPSIIAENVSMIGRCCRLPNSLT